MNELKSAVGSNWREIAEHEAARVELQAQVELARLAEERRCLEARHTRVAGSLDECGVSEARLRSHTTAVSWWGVLFLLAVGVVGASAWWSVSWYLTLGWEKLLLAVTVVVLPLIGWIAFLRSMNMPEETLRRITTGLGIAIVSASLVAAGSLALGRTAGLTMIEERQVASAQGSDDLDRSPASVRSVARAERVKRVLAITSMVAMLFLGIAGEAAAGIAFDELMRHGTVVRTVRPLYVEREGLEARLAENAHLQEALRRRGRLTLLSRTIDGLRQEAARAREAEEAARLRDEEERRSQSLGPLFWKVAIALVILFTAAIVFATLATGEERTLSGSNVVLVDLSASTVGGEFSKNLRAVEGVIRRVGDGGRLTVLGITEASFAVEPLLQAAAPRSKGRFGEYLEGWRETTVREWRKTAASLRPSARGTDLFGALARAAIECEGTMPDCQLIVLSDMRQVGRGVNLERAGAVPARLIDVVRRDGLVPRLRGVHVWALGVHTAGIDERQWQSLRAFWTEYFRLAGADLVAFTPNRRLAE